MGRLRQWWSFGAVAVAALVSGVACTAVAPMRDRAARDFDCPRHRVEIQTEGTLGPEPLDRRAIRTELSATQREPSPSNLQVVAFAVEGCGHADLYLCSRHGRGRPFRCGVMIR